MKTYDYEVTFAKAWPATEANVKIIITAESEADCRHKAFGEVIDMGKGWRVVSIKRVV